MHTLTHTHTLGNMNLYNFGDDTVWYHENELAVKSLMVILVAYYELLNLKHSSDKCSSSPVSYLGITL